MYKNPIPVGVLASTVSEDPSENFLLSNVTVRGKERMMICNVLTSSAPTKTVGQTEVGRYPSMYVTRLFLDHFGLNLVDFVPIQFDQN